MLCEDGESRIPLAEARLDHRSMCRAFTCQHLRVQVGAVLCRPSMA